METIFSRILWTIALTVLLIGAAFGQKAGSSTSSVSNATSSIGFSSEPKIVSGGTFTIPSWIIKKGLEGTVTLSVDLDQSGKVERSAVVSATHSVLDSIAQSSIKNLVCTPAFEKGKAAPSTVSLQICFILDSMIAASKAISPDIEGVVLDKKSKFPVSNAIVNLEFTDTVGDQDLAIGFSKYLAMIGKLPTQGYIRGMLSTKTDVAGRFAFRLLPFCPVKIAVLADGYAIADFYEHPKPEIKIMVKYLMNLMATDTARFDSSNITNVYGYAPASRENINVERAELERGLTHSASKLLLSQSTIRQMPEGGSALLVRSGSPYDNRYLISGVPFLAPFHFGGYPYGDLDGMMISALSDIKVTVNDIAGKYADVSGALIEANPGIYRPANPNLIPRPELAIDYGFLGCDMMLSIPTDKNGKDILQIGSTFPDNYFLKFLYGFYGSSDAASLDLGQPKTYYNVTINDSKRIGPLQLESFGWFADDSYMESQETYPWGMGSVTVHPVDRDNLSLTCGGSRQYFAKGKRVGGNVFLTKTFLSNGTLDFKNDSIPVTSAVVGFDCRLNCQAWEGTVEQTDSRSMPMKDSRKARQADLQVRSSIEKEVGKLLRVRAQVLGDGVIYDKVPDAFMDGGVSLLWNFGDVQTELNAGRVTSRPDIRGLPDSVFRMQQLHSYLVSLPLHYRNSSGIEIGIQPYLRYQDKCPHMDPLDNIWDTSATSPLFARGMDFNGEVQLLENLSINGVINMEDAKRIGAAVGSIYEWNIPWSFRGGVHCSFFHKALHIYLDYVLTNGMPYFDFNENTYSYLPTFNRLDFSVQYRTLVLKHRYLTRYDCYLNLRNISDLVNMANIRDYYWDYSMAKYPIFLCPFLCEAGIRIGLRL
jgi:Gram-negative bacterial tonB protein.